MQAETRSPPALTRPDRHAFDRDESRRRDAHLHRRPLQGGRSGVATFTGCSIDRIGTGYTLAAFSSGLSGATSVAFNVTVPGTTISLTRSHGMITYGESVTFAVQFGAGGANRPFVIQYTSVGVPWTTIANLVTNSSGFASFASTPSRTGYVRAVYAGATDLGASTSTVYIVGVRQTVST